MTPGDIELLFQSRKDLHGSVEVQEDDEDIISDQEKDIRVTRLKEVLDHAHKAWASSSEELDLIAEKVADGSREGQFSPQL